MAAPLVLKRPRLADAFSALGLATEFAHWQTPFARTVLNLHGNPRELGPFEALGYLGEVDPHAAWESIITHDLCPAGWQHDARTFHADPERRRGMPRAEPSELTSTPPTLRACIALGCDPAGIARAEELALEFFRRTHPSSPAFSGEIAWRVARARTFLDDLKDFRAAHQEALDEARELSALLDQLEASRYGLARVSRERMELTAPCVESCAWW